MIQYIFNQLRGQGVSALMVRAGSTSFLTNVAGAGLGFAAQVVLARTMGKEQFGPYIFVVSWLSVLIIFAQLGYDQLVLRFLSVYRAQAKWPLFRGLCCGSTMVALVLGSLIGMLMTVTVWAARFRLDANLSDTFKVAAFVLPLLALAYVVQNALQALKHPVLGQIPMLVLRPTLVILGVAFAYFVMDPNLSPSDAMCVNLVATVGALAFGLYAFHRRMPPEARRGPVEYQPRMWTITALPFVAQTGFYNLARRTDVLMLGYFEGVVDSGVYVAAARMAEFGGFGLLAMNVIAAPLIAEAFAANDMSKLQRITAITAALALLIALPVTIVFCVAGGVLLQIFGEGFSEARFVLVILAFGMLGNVLTGPVGVTLMMTGRQNLAAGAATLSASINIALNFLLIPPYGLEGAAIATAITYLVTNVLMLFIVMKSIRINPTILGLITRISEAG